MVVINSTAMVMVLGRKVYFIVFVLQDLKRLPFKQKPKDTEPVTLAGNIIHPI